MTILSPKSKVAKAKLGGMNFMYNPSAFNDKIGVNYNELTTAGISYPILTYGGGKTRRVSFDIYLNDRVEAGITKRFIANLHSYIPPASMPYQFFEPPTIKFAYGWFVKDCRLEDMDIDYTAFSPDLQPIEATVKITLAIVQ